MPTLLYIHGFLSSPRSHKAEQVKQYCLEHHPEIDYCCPQLGPYPDKCAEQLESLVSTAKQPVYLIGSSMGGFWATWLAERHGCKAVLVNPAVDVLELMPNYVDIPLKNYHHDETYRLSNAHLSQLKKYVTNHINNPSRYWLMVQKGDETLDYRLAVEQYADCRQTIEPGGDHSFQHFERYFAEIFNFFRNEK